MEKIVVVEGSRLRFDAIYTEYSVAVLDGYEFFVFYCPFCGAKMPESQRGSYFTSVTNGEEERILSLVADCGSLSAIETLLGQPDQKFSATEHFDPIEKQKLFFPATHVYTRLSEMAELRVTFDQDGAIVKKLVLARCIRS